MATPIVETGTSKQELYLFSRRDEEEKNRLEEQSKAIRVVREGHVLDPRIPKQDVSRIADIATGTGIWLREVAAELADSGNNAPVEMVGFDISAEQFPKSPAPKNKLVLWDMTTRFPKEYHGSFDVVHVRLVVLAIKVEQIKGVVQNLVELLRPGGYLQWSDISYKTGRMITYPDDYGDLSLKPQVDMMLKYWNDQGLSLDITGDVEKALQDLPVEEVHVTDHSDACFRRPEINDVVVEWQSRAESLIMEMLSSRNGLSKEQAKMVAYAYRKKILEKAKQGVIFRVTMATLVARRNIELRGNQK
ncbi:9abfd9f2-14c5-4750-8050-f80144710643 [Sclerotinia trifoliorum]|uniref:9abfd9f2-14c5-4750-8050-f80144710643 n=1 Tax=Sclerotinia trifoliorum TaxID=28548 RepID=A0A8H2VLM1_9HELO|nr:9abfd9f2-14c5-4750-8050-f80144710643 [Sclerotinia trifoliorum]